MGFGGVWGRPHTTWAVRAALEPATSTHPPTHPPPPPPPTPSRPCRHHALPSVPPHPPHHGLALRRRSHRPALRRGQAGGGHPHSIHRHAAPAVRVQRAPAVQGASVLLPHAHTSSHIPPPISPHLSSPPPPPSIKPRPPPLPSSLPRGGHRRCLPTPAAHSCRHPLTRPVHATAAASRLPPLPSPHSECFHSPPAARARALPQLQQQRCCCCVPPHACAPLQAASAPPPQTSLPRSSTPPPPPLPPAW